MGEETAIARTQGHPATIESLMTDLQSLGVEEGMVLLLHSSLSSLGWVSGGAVAVILALEEVLGIAGTLVMPAHSGDLSDPANWRNPPVPESWWKIIRSSMPPFDPDLTPTRMMGSISETFRKQPSVLRSDHPQVSFTAWGAQSEIITQGHEHDFGLGEGSPLARIYELGGWVLFIGVGYENNTSFHLAELRAQYPGKKVITSGAPIVKDGHRQWVELRDIDLDDSDFQKMGGAFESDTDHVRTGKVAEADCKLIPLIPMVDFAVQWMNTNRR